MKERRPMDAREAGDERPGMGDAELDERIARDLGALRSVRAQGQDLPSLHETIRAAQDMRPDPGLETNGIRRMLMQALGFIRTRPLAAAAREVTVTWTDCDCPAVMVPPVKTTPSSSSAVEGEMSSPLATPLGCASDSTSTR